MFFEHRKNTGIVIFLPHMPFRGFLSGVSCSGCDDMCGFASPEQTFGPPLSLMLEVEKVWSSKAHTDPFVSLFAVLHVWMGVSE